MRSLPPLRLAGTTRTRKKVTKVKKEWNKTGTKAAKAMKDPQVPICWKRRKALQGMNRKERP